MILVGSQRGGGAALAAHLLNDRDNDHVTVHELRGFVGAALPEAMDEARAVARGTKAKQYLFSLSLNPPRDGDAALDDLLAAADRAEQALGLTCQPRAVVIHEKKGRRHLHVVWSRTDARTMTAVPLPFFKTRLNTLARDLYLDHGWTLPDGFKTNRWKNPLNFTLAEWQQAGRVDLDPRELKQLFAQAWQASDSLPAPRRAGNSRLLSRAGRPPCPGRGRCPRRGGFGRALDRAEGQGCPRPPGRARHGRHRKPCRRLRTCARRSARDWRRRCAIWSISPAATRRLSPSL